MYGTVGQLFLVVAFLASIASAAGYFVSALRERAGFGELLGYAAWGVVILTTVGAFVLLSYLFVTHQYQYAYVYQHASNDLPWYLLLSGVWAGQEGSFLLWGVFTSLVGGAFLVWGVREYKPPVMTVVALSQGFLLSMIVGLSLGPIEIGSMPFSGLAEAFPDAEIFRANPDFVPADGTGLNPILENFWITAHPTTLFLGFALLTVPFGYAVAALWKRKYTQWVRPALPWMLGGLLTLGLSIALGGYWAYVTLSFGGYWAWDPVENASLVPWLVGVAALHAMLIQKKSGRAHKAALGLTILTFLLALYESFLTRSGVLSEVSVHSFTDLGLYGQLVTWMVVMGGGAFGLFVWRYRELPTPDRESNLLSREFLLFTGVVLLMAVATVVIIGTSAPILGYLFRDQPSTVPVEFYGQWTLPLAIGIAFLAGLAQLVWWNKMSVENVSRALLKPFELATLSTVVVLVMTPFAERTVGLDAIGGVSGQAATRMGFGGGLEEFWGLYGQSLLLLLLVFAAFVAFYANGFVLWRILRGNPRMAGGALAHVGLGLVLLGIVASSGMSTPLSTRGPDGSSQDYFVLHHGETRQVEEYEVHYRGKSPGERGRTAYQLDVDGPDGRSFSVAPVAYKSGDQWVQQPDIERFFTSDLYVAVTPRAMQDDLEQKDRVDDSASKKGGEIAMATGDSTVVGGGTFAIELVGLDQQVDSESVPDSAQVAVAAVVDVTRLQDGTTRRLRSVHLVMPDGSRQSIETGISEWDVAVSFVGVDVQSKRVHLRVDGVEVPAEDWVVVQASLKPFIHVFWLGILVLMGGVLVAMVRRIQDLNIWRRRVS